MKREDIIRMAREAGFEDFERWSDQFPEKVETWVRCMTEFHALATAAEREACARVCDEWTRTPATTGMELTLVAAAIRARKD